MASNKHSLIDENGDHSDWIEIFNPDNSSVNMAGWSLTDNASNFRKWIFPAVTIPSGAYLVVFASGKDRRVAGQPLHTNFSLSADGEYLALVKPDGQSISSQFSPKFPAQLEDISYGISSSLQTEVFCQQGSVVRAYIPSDDTLGTSWRALTFADGNWLSGTLPVGFFNFGKTSNPDLSSTLGLDIKAQMAGQAKSAYIRIPFSVNNPSKIQQLTLRANYDDGFAAFINGVSVASSNTPTVTSLTYNSLALGVHNPEGFEQFDVSAMIPQLRAGTNILAIQELNETAGSSDAYVLLELTALVNSDIDPIVGYFRTPTPGAQNGGPDSVMLPQTVTLSRSSGTFATSFSLVMSGATSGQHIRYVIADPSDSSGANIAPPTKTSTLYTGPFQISSSKLIRAAVFDDTTGQQGITTTAEYLLLETAATNNTSNFISNLPIFVADDHGAGQPVDSSTNTYTTSMLYIFTPSNNVAALSSPPTLFTRGGLRVRGRSSQSFPKKSYGMKTWDETNADANLPLLTLAKSSNWILNGPWYYDNTYIHNAFMYEIARQTGHWAPRTQFIEMFSNINGGKLDLTDYAGVYVLMEKIESGHDRLNITGIRSEDNSGAALTGGYIFKIDAADPDEVSWHTTRSIPNSESGQSLVLVEPNASHDTSEQVDYIQHYIQNFEDALYADAASGFTTHWYRNFIDSKSWIDYHIVNVLSYNTDGLRLSTFFFKDRNEKIHAGPLWDYDRSLGSDDGRDAIPSSWSNIEYYFTRDWWGPLFQDPDFVQAWADRWWNLRSDALSDANLNSVADSLGATIGNAAGARDAARWPDNASTGGIYLNEISRMKSWLTSANNSTPGRTKWLDSQVPQPPATTVATGVVQKGTPITLNGAGMIGFTTDGTDPRASNTSPSAQARIFNGSPIIVNQTTVLWARRQGSFVPFPGAVGINWSASVKRVYLVDEAFATASDIMISEISYHPTDPTSVEAAQFPGGISAADFEFIEMRNIGSRNVNTYEMQFAKGAPFDKLTLDPLTLKPGDFAIVVKNQAAFILRYGSDLQSKIVGEWGDGSLSNDGERIELFARDGSLIVDESYKDDAYAGRSLNRVDNLWRVDVPSPGFDGPTYSQWAQFYYPQGKAGAHGSDDTDGDGISNAEEYAQGSDPTFSDNQELLRPSANVFTEDSNRFYEFTFKQLLNRPSARYIAEQSTDLINWSPANATLVSSSLGIETRMVKTPIDGSTFRYFVRLKITIAP